MRILFRCDASPLIGTGHFMRCLALAQACRLHGDAITFVMAQCPSEFEERLRAQDIELFRLLEQSSTEDCRQSLVEAARISADVFVLDGYHFDSTYSQAVKGAGYKLLLLDDLNQLSHYSAHWVLNQNLYAEPTQYAQRDSDTRLLLGPRFSLLRPEFAQHAAAKRALPATALNLLMTFGGSDPAHFTMKAVRALSFVRTPLKTVVLVGAGNLQRAELENAARAAGNSVQVRFNVQNVAESMAWADLAVAAAGSTCWELACMSVPTILCVIADNQRDVARVLHERDSALNLGWHADITPQALASAIDDLAHDQERRAFLSQNLAAVCDGLGAQRVAEALRS